MTDQLTGYEASSVVEVGAVLDDSPADAEEVYLRTIGHSERAIAAVAAKRAGSGAGGSLPALTGFQVWLPSDVGAITVSSNGSRIPFSVVTWDSDGFWQADDDRAIVPTGKGGIYEVSLFLPVNDGGQTGQAIFGGVSSLEGLDWFIDGSAKHDAGGNVGWSDAGAFVGRYADGDRIEAGLSWWPFSVASLEIGGGGYLAAIRRGDLPT